jgi:hypothetical protein
VDLLASSAAAPSGAPFACCVLCLDGPAGTTPAVTRMLVTMTPSTNIHDHERRRP